MTIAGGRSLELFYIDGHADGMLTAELYNWTGHVLMAPRTQLVEALKRSEPKCTGVYLLLGEQNGEPLAYIGESDDVGQRLKSHDLNKDWWTSVVFITTAGNKLNKAHVRYLEARLISEANKIGRMPLDNGTAPPVPSLSEADIAKMEAFLENLLTVLPAVRVDMFIERGRSQGTIAPTLAEFTLDVAKIEARFVLHNKKHSIIAHAVLMDGNFIVEPGSQARSSWDNANPHTYAQLYSELKRSAVLKDEPEHSIFTQGYVFRSPSAAAAIVNGRPSNGTLDWKHVTNGETYKQWEIHRLNSEDMQLIG